MLDGSPYQGYLYAYPHKSAYRPLRPRPALRDVWAAEPRDALFLYLHIPFCEMRCGFCNLFTRANPPAEQAAAYLRQLRHQAVEVAAALGPAGFARAAIGGGTPTYLTADELTELFSITRDVLGLDPRRALLSVETSPATATPDRLAVLAANGTHRVSIGVQSFLDSEAHAAGRPQRRAEVDAALDAIRAAEVPLLNVDLIYGIPGQTAATWEQSLRTALTWRPEEIYLYPLYVRPLTGLGRRAPDGPDPAWDAERLDRYRHGRDLLREAGYRQLSMRQFRHETALDAVGDADYCCQDDGMVGLGCGARSYTTDLHYSFDYAVSVGEVRAIIDDYLRRPPADFGFAEFGFRLDADEQRLRWLVKSLLRAEGADVRAYAARFGTGLLADFPHLAKLTERGWAAVSDDRVTLTDEGLAHSDSIGPWTVSDRVRDAMAGAVLR
ncbi:oxygen-independent coproporphyrinogen-3 oxidase [Allocatelliglobosispora scoriae]|uniref:Heme chaperone HemW n=1 Tax=Allocatelliglobosispora scoriae TaxID=643052 RepID=A0A841BP91_9ACTN|nr:STM4012 family radical SAM protein [Allocatelliglobosispora scoriae]MBB5869009.1 oxygen-independent coproporphyrinogen-3 oxidase [Allocatelliglobosispora scoriae]